MSDATTSLELVGDCEILISRSFSAPAALVFEAWTKPALVRRWWAPHALGVQFVSCEADVRPGGRYRYVLRRGDGQEIAFSGQYSEVSPPTRLVYTQLYEPMAAVAGAVDVTVSFVERAGRTQVQMRQRCPSKPVRDAIVASGMERGMRETLQQLDALLASD